MFTGTDIRKLQEIINRLSNTVSNLEQVVTGLNNVATKLDGISTINTGIKQRVPDITLRKFYLRAQLDEQGAPIANWLGEEPGSEKAEMSRGVAYDYSGFGDDIGYVIAGTVVLHIHEYSDDNSPDTIYVRLKDGAGNVVKEWQVDLVNTVGGGDGYHTLTASINATISGVMSIEIVDDGTGITSYFIYGDSYIVLPLRRP